MAFLVQVPPALAYAPEVLARAQWLTEEDFARDMYTLVRLALETNRTAVYAAPPCNASWVGGAANNKLPLAMNHAK